MKYLLIIIILVFTGCGQMTCEGEGIVIPESCALDTETGACFELLKLCNTTKCTFPEGIEPFGICVEQ